MSILIVIYKYMKKIQKDNDLKNMWEFWSKIEWYLKQAREEWFIQAMERFWIKEDWKDKLSELELENKILKKKIQWAQLIMTMFKLTSKWDKTYYIDWTDCIKLADAVLEELQ